ncbi:MAG TPA: DUF2752 domain-containing protein [Actinomycetota bacterium]|nr:DUF2752 domain-containing protein [Actinomycetota bacterium]
MPTALARVALRTRDTSLFLAGLGLAVGLHLVDPTEVSIPTCPFRAITGLACPGCGTLRCLHALLGGDVAGALDLNALTVLALPLLVAAWLGTGYRAMLMRPPPLRIEPAWVGQTVAVGAGLFWVLRNLPWEPFRWLAP